MFTPRSSERRASSLNFSSLWGMSFPPKKCELSGGARKLAFALATRVYDFREHVRFAQDQHLVGAELDLGPAVLREDDLLALGDVHLDVLPVLVAGTRSDRQHAAALRLLPRRVRQNNPAHRQLLPVKDLDDQTVTKRLQIHEGLLQRFYRSLEQWFL